MAAWVLLRSATIFPVGIWFYVLDFLSANPARLLISFILASFFISWPCFWRYGSMTSFLPRSVFHLPLASCEFFCFLCRGFWPPLTNLPRSYFHLALLDFPVSLTGDDFPMIFGLALPPLTRGAAVGHRRFRPFQEHPIVPPRTVLTRGAAYGTPPVAGHEEDQRELQDRTSILQKLCPHVRDQR